MVSSKIMGGIGNVCFQVANVLAHSIKYNLDYCIPLTNDNPHYVGQKPYIFPSVNYCDKELNLPLYKENNFHYEEIPLVDNVCFDGYFQSWRYFSDYRDGILKAFGFKWEMKTGWVSLHIRLGDYLKLQNFHPVISKEYISAAINHYVERGYKKFVVFSDGMDWCFENINEEAFPDCEFEYSEGRTEIEDLQYGSCAEHQIGSNSTFSIWQHILNRNPLKTGVFPKNWFGPSLNHDTEDLYPEKCIKL